VLVAGGVRDHDVGMVRDAGLEQALPDQPVLLRREHVRAEVHREPGVGQHLEGQHRPDSSAGRGRDSLRPRAKDPQSRRATTPPTTRSMGTPGGSRKLSRPLAKRRSRNRIATGSTCSSESWVTYPESSIHATASAPESNQSRMFSVQASWAVRPPWASRAATCSTVAGTLMKWGSPNVSLSFR